jgi:hypothetical protein
MSVAALETRIEYTYTTKKGVMVVIADVPVTTAREASGEEHQVFSMAVAMRLEELIKRAKNAGDAPGTVLRFNF